MQRPTVNWTPITSTAQGIYRPEAYGAPGGTDAAVDMPLVQAAIDAAEAAGGGTVRLDKTYAYLAQGTEAYIGCYPGVTYGFWINGSNIVLDGNNTGILKITGMPTFTTSFIGVLVGNGGYAGGAYVGWDTIKATGTWIRNSTVKNLTFDNSALSAANIISLTVSAISSCVALCFCDYGAVQNVTIDKSWGSTGGITSHCSSLHSTIKDITITLAYHLSVHIDGSEDGTFENITITNFAIATPVGIGINCAANSDYRHGSYRNTIKNCTVSECHIGIAATGEDNVITDNTINFIDSSTTHVGIQLTTYSNVVGKYVSHANVVTGNAVTQLGVRTSWGVYLIGENVNAYDAAALECDSHVITDNTFTNLVFGLNLYQQSKNNIFIENTLTGCIGISVDTSGGTATGNVIQT